MRWLLIAVLLIAIGTAWAAPPAAPAIPTEMPPQDLSVALTVPGAPNVNATVNITYDHTAPTPLACTLWINTNNWTATVNGTHSQTVTLENGNYVSFVNCTNQSIAISSGITLFAVTNAQTNSTNSTNTTNTTNTTNATASVTLLYPLERAHPELNVTFKHNFSPSANCSVYLDNTSAPPLDSFLVAANALESENYDLTNRQGMHNFTVTCVNGTWSGSVTRLVNVTNQTLIVETLSITPKETLTYTDVKIKGAFAPYKRIVLTILSSAGTERKNLTTESDGTFAYTYKVGSATGTYRVNATSENATLNGTFVVKDRQPYIMILGNTTNITEGAGFVLEGYEFLPNDNITLLLTGGGTTLSNITQSDSGGYFEFSYPRTLAARTYTITAKGTDASYTDSISITVVPKARTNTSTWTNTSTGNGNANTNTGGNSQEEEVEDPPVNAYEPDPSYEPEQYEPLPPETEYPAEVEDSSWTWLYIVLGLLIAGAGGVGYLVYNGTIDLSQFGIGGAQPGHTPAGAPIDYADEQTIKSFIFGERGKGFDDLTIRSALVAKGWDKEEVDRVFDEVYKN